jgi:hypothetical protein
VVTIQHHNSGIFVDYGETWSKERIGRGGKEGGIDEISFVNYLGTPSNIW